MSDYYQTLGVFRDATSDDIKKAYRKLAMEHHPDRNNSPDAEAKFKELSEAYQILSDPQKRAHFDQFGSAPSGAGPAGGGFGGFEHIDLSEALSMFMRDFGGAAGGFDGIFGGRGGGDMRRGQDVKVTVRISLREVVTGAKRSIKLKTLGSCETCSGSGAGGGTVPTPCGSCGGTGEVRRAARSVFGQFVQVGPCGTCRGEGSVIRTPCEVCRGEGRIKTERVVSVEVPKGVSSQNYITLREQGAVGQRGGPAGDLVVMIEVKGDEEFTRDGDDLWLDLPVAFSQAALGESVSIPTPHGDQPIEIAPGTQPDSIITLRGKGLPRLGSNAVGNFNVRVKLWTPKNLSEEQKTLFEQLATHEEDGPDNDGPSFWSRLKEALGA